MEKEEKLTIVSAASAVTDIKIDYVTDEIVGVSYKTLAGNKPDTFGNFVAIWQNQNEIPWHQAPHRLQSITTSTQAGSLAFENLSITNHSYIIGYAVGPMKSEAQEYGYICSTAFIPEAANKGGESYEYFQSSIVIQHIGTTSLAIQYMLPHGNQPVTNKSWLGLWRSSVPSYTNPPLASTSIKGDFSNGTAAFNNLTLGRGQTYAVALFMGGWAGEGKVHKQTTMACSLNFTV